MTVAHEEGKTKLEDVGLPQIEISLLTGGQDMHYAFGLTRSLLAGNVGIDLIGSDDMNISQWSAYPRLHFYDLRRLAGASGGIIDRLRRVSTYYLRLVVYAATARPEIFHILWNNRFEFFDRTFLMAYYKLLGKKVVLTAHNINSAERDGQDSVFNRLTLRIQYRLSDSIFVHTQQMKRALIRDFGVPDSNIIVIPYGINDEVPETDLTPQQAREKLGIMVDEKVLLFFGAIAPYKGLLDLVEAFRLISVCDRSYRLVIAGKPKGGCEKYLRDIENAVAASGFASQVKMNVGYVPNEDIEIYFKAADLLVVPYTQIFQSGILFLGFRFGLPVVATDVGSFSDDVVNGKTGYICRAQNPDDIAAKITEYFGSMLFQTLGTGRHAIKEHVSARHSWDEAGKLTKHAYARLIAKEHD
jgi:D-inositol-3-phosphate glycosyltransferase